ncbi:MAG: hypothetical protein QOD92_3644 [Acidimicrobiaceae bacterium]
MTWAKFDDRCTSDPRLIGLPRGVRLLHFEAIVWSCAHLTDGTIQRHALHWLTDEPESESAVAQLVQAGLWAVADDGWEIVDFLADQPSAADVEKVRDLARERQRKRRQHQAGDHSLCTDARYCRYVVATDHGAASGAKQKPLISYYLENGEWRQLWVDQDGVERRTSTSEVTESRLRSGGLADRIVPHPDLVTRDLTRESQRESQPPVPIRPDPTIREGKEDGEGAGIGTALEAPASTVTAKINGLSEQLHKLAAPFNRELIDYDDATVDDFNRFTIVLNDYEGSNVDIDVQTAVMGPGLTDALNALKCGDDVDGNVAPGDREASKRAEFEDASKRAFTILSWVAEAINATGAHTTCEDGEELVPQTGPGEGAWLSVNVPRVEAAAWVKRFRTMLERTLETL